MSRPRPTRIAGLGLLAACLGCQPPAAPPPAPPAVQGVVDDAAGIAFSLPAGWAERPAVGLRLFVPAAAASAATVVLQVAPSSLTQVDAALDAAFTPVAAQAGFTWGRRVATLVDGSTVLAYQADYEHLEVPRRRAGLLLLQPGVVVDLSYNAPAAAFDADLAALVALQESLQVAAQNGPGVVPLL